MVTVHELASLIVSREFDGSPGGEHFQGNVEITEKELLASLEQGWDKIWYVKVPVERPGR